MDDPLQNRCSCIGDQSIKCNIFPWKIFSRCFINKGQFVAKCQGVSSSSLHNLQEGSMLLSWRLLCLFRLQWPDINWTSFPSSNLVNLVNTLSILFELFSYQSLVCLQLLRFFHLLFQSFSKAFFCNIWKTGLIIYKLKLHNK